MGTSEVEMVLATQTLLQRKPRTYEVKVTGGLNPGVTAKGPHPEPDLPDRDWRRALATSSSTAATRSARSTWSSG